MDIFALNGSIEVASFVSYSCANGYTTLLEGFGSPSSGLSTWEKE
jgi:hypothetical protein